MKAWEKFLTIVEQKLSKEIIDQWLRPLKISRFDAANLYLQATDPMQISWFEEHIRPLLKHRFFNENHRPIKVHLQLASLPMAQKEAFKPSPIPFSPSPLDSSYLIEHFLVFKENQIAYKLIKEWIDTFSCPFNPLFLYGSEGSGKTHLLMAIANAFAKQKKRVFYVSADVFTEHVVQAIRTGRMQEFRSIYRQIDILLMDDVHKLGGRAATQEEFFHTFNNLHTLGKQILLASRIIPSQLQEIEPRLVSRFEWGLSLGLGKIDPVSLISKKANLWSMNINEEIIAFLASQFPQKPLIALQALAIRAPSVSSVEEAQILLKDLLENEMKEAMTPEKLIKMISSHFGITSEDLLGKSQQKEFSLPRQIAMYLCRDRLKLPFKAIGKIFSRDHSTVMSSVEQIKEKIAQNRPEVIEAASLVKSKI